MLVMPNLENKADACGYLKQTSKRFLRSRSTKQTSWHFSEELVTSRAFGFPRGLTVHHQSWKLHSSQVTWLELAIFTSAFQFYVEYASDGQWMDCGQSALLSEAETNGLAAYVEHFNSVTYEVPFQWGCCGLKWCPEGISTQCLLIMTPWFK